MPVLDRNGRQRPSLAPVAMVPELTDFWYAQVPGKCMGCGADVRLWQRVWWDAPWRSHKCPGKVAA